MLLNQLNNIVLLFASKISNNLWHMKLIPHWWRLLLIFMCYFSSFHLFFYMDINFLEKFFLILWNSYRPNILLSFNNNSGRHHSSQLFIFMSNRNQQQQLYNTKKTFQNQHCIQYYIHISMVGPYLSLNSHIFSHSNMQIYKKKIF